MTRNCDHCGEPFGPGDEYVGLNPMFVAEASEEHQSENIGWYVHWDCADEFLQHIRGKYDFSN